MVNVVLRPLAPGDIPAVALFEREIAEISFPDDPVTDLGFYERKLSQALGDGRNDAIVAVVGDRLAGWLWISARENFTTKERYGALRSFYVTPEHRGAGVAFALMRRAKDVAAARGYGKLVGRTAATNEAMKALYALYGYEAKHVVYELALDGAETQRPRAPAHPERFNGERGRVRKTGSRSSGSHGP
jgi:GNAT superfamily N-acetyltransferase